MNHLVIIKDSINGHGIFPPRPEKQYWKSSVQDREASMWLEFFFSNEWIGMYYDDSQQKGINL